MHFRNLTLLAACLCTFSISQAQTYQIGDIADDFVLPNRLEGGTSRLSDYVGHVILVEWFAHWCPFCQAAAFEIDPGIIQYYENLGGTANGLPFMRIGMNLQRDTTRDRPGTDAFVSTHKIDPVLEDTSRVVARRFVPSGGQPIFAIINGIPDSPTHELWEIIDIRSGYLTTSTPIEDLRAAIDSVGAPLPSDVAAIRSPALTPTGALRFKVSGNNRSSIQLMRSRNLTTWTPVTATIPESSEDYLELNLSSLEGDYYLQAVRQ